MVERNFQYGIHSVMIHDINNGYKPYANGFMEVLGGLTIASTQEDVELRGGSNLGIWAIENGNRSDEFSFTVRQMEPAMMTQFAGAVLTEIAASATGSISNSLINTKGTSVLNATTGIASVGIKSGSETDLKSGDYFIEAITSTTVNVYCSTNIDFDTNGAQVEFQDDTYKLLASNVTVTASTASTLTGLGLEITGGSGTIGMTVGDVAAFSVSPAHGGIYSYSIGENGEYPDYVGLTCYGQKMADGSHFKIRIPKIKFAGVPIGFGEKAFFEAEITGKPIQAQDWLSTRKASYFIEQAKGA